MPRGLLSSMVDEMRRFLPSMGWIIGEAAKLSKGIRDKLENMGFRILTINGNANMNAMLRENILHRPVRQDLRS
jgi:hypothetical protein